MYASGYKRWGRLRGTRYAGEPSCLRLPTNPMDLFSLRPVKESKQYCQQCRLLVASVQFHICDDNGQDKASFTAVYQSPDS